MDLAPDQAALAVERHDCPNCDAPAGSACRTRGGKTAAKYHPPRFVLVPALREELEILVPADRFPGRAWKQGPALAIVPAPRTERPVRIGYARTSTARQELASQLEALHRAGCHKVFSEQISTRVKVRPELENIMWWNDDNSGGDGGGVDHMSIVTYKNYNTYWGTYTNWYGKT